MIQDQFSAVTLLITHYNRSRSLERLLQTFATQQIVFGDIVVSDDGSKPEHLDYLKAIRKIVRSQHLTLNFNIGEIWVDTESQVTR